MAYSAAFMAKIAQKPSHLTPSEASRVFATMRGWEYRSPQHENERYQNMVTEVIETCPGLSLILDVNAGETIADRDNINIANPMVFGPVGFTRRSRRRYSITIGLSERLFIAQRTPAINIDFHIDNLTWNALDANGNTLMDNQSVPQPLPTIRSLQIDGSTTARTEVGRLVFDLPTLGADPETFHVTIGQFRVNTSATVFTGNDIEDETGRKWVTSPSGGAFDATAVNGATIEMVNPTTTEAR